MALFDHQARAHHITERRSCYTVCSLLSSFGSAKHLFGKSRREMNETDCDGVGLADQRPPIGGTDLYGLVLYSAIWDAEHGCCGSELLLDNSVRIAILWGYDRR